MTKQTPIESTVLHPDAPAVPAGMRRKDGVEYGCGDSSCTMCYMPAAEPRPQDERKGSQ